MEGRGTVLLLMSVVSVSLLLLLRVLFLASLHGGCINKTLASWPGAVQFGRNLAVAGLGLTLKQPKSETMSYVTTGFRFLHREA